MTKTLGIFVFDEIEVLDFSGPFEVFSVANRVAARAGLSPPFRVLTISRSGEAVMARGGYHFMPSHGFGDALALDILIVPGGVVDAECQRAEVIDWIKTVDAGTALTASVCTGAFLLAEAGLLDGRRATTHWEDSDDLERRYPQVRVERDRPWVDEGRIVTSGGISAGISMSLHLVRLDQGEDFAKAVARQMEYTWND